MLQLTIMRHGEAEPMARGVKDADRKLTPYGLNQAVRTAQQLVALEQTPETIICSPYCRAQQTARECADILGIETLQLDDGFTPDASVTEAIEKLPETGNVLLVSHMPLVSYLTGLLIDGNPYVGPGYGTASAVVIELEYPAAGLGRFIRRIDSVV
ncbi:phosphohistidine phosphatase SixA [Spongorhabdus nitratireducens]